MLIEVITYRWRRRVVLDENIDVGVRRTASEIAAWKRRDPVGRLLQAMLVRGYYRAEYEALKQSLPESFDDAMTAARSAPWPESERLFETVYAAPRRLAASLAQTPCVHVNSVHAIRAAHEYFLKKHKEVFLLDKGVWSPRHVGNLKTDLDKQFGKNRVIDSPLPEAVSTGIAVGASLSGYRPVVINPRVDFIILARDVTADQASELAHMLGGRKRASVTIRGIVNQSDEQDTQHSQARHFWFAYLRSLSVAMPANVADASDLFIASMLSDDPELYICERRLYDLMDELPPLCELEIAFRRRDASRQRRRRSRSLRYAGDRSARSRSRRLLGEESGAASGGGWRLNQLRPRGRGDRCCRRMSGALRFRSRPGSHRHACRRAGVDEPHTGESLLRFRRVYQRTRAGLICQMIAATSSICCRASRLGWSPLDAQTAISRRYCKIDIKR
jgi:hypothetical protein